jgi:hypothetical protein
MQDQEQGNSSNLRNSSASAGVFLKLLSDFAGNIQADPDTA